MELTSIRTDDSSKAQIANRALLVAAQTIKSMPSNARLPGKYRLQNLLSRSHSQPAFTFCFDHCHNRTNQLSFFSSAGSAATSFAGVAFQFSTIVSML